jgi:hypothetical protein
LISPNYCVGHESFNPSETIYGYVEQPRIPYGVVSLELTRFSESLGRFTPKKSASNPEVGKKVGAMATHTNKRVPIRKLVAEQAFCYEPIFITNPGGSKIASATMLTITPMNSGHLQETKFGDGGNLFIPEMPVCVLGRARTEGDNLGPRPIAERQLRGHVGCSFSHAFPADSWRHGGSSPAASRSESSGRATIKSRRGAMTAIRITCTRQANLFGLINESAVCVL